MESSSNKGVVIGIIAITALIFGGLIAAVVLSPSSSNQPGIETGLTFNDADDVSVGAAAAQVVVRIYSDFQCPACRASEPILEQIISKYQDRVKFIFKDFPLEQMHAQARLGANAARCAQDQGKYMEMHNLLFAKQDEWVNAPDPASVLVGYGASLGLDQAKFQACVQNRAFDAKVAANAREGLSNNVNATPTFFINNVRYTGMYADQWAKVLDAALASPSSTKP